MHNYVVVVDKNYSQDMAYSIYVRLVEIVPAQLNKIIAGTYMLHVALHKTLVVERACETRKIIFREVVLQHFVFKRIFSKIHERVHKFKV